MIVPDTAYTVYKYVFLTDRQIIYNDITLETFVLKKALMKVPLQKGRKKQTIQK